MYQPDWTAIESRGYPLVMGIVNITPDSFSDGGLFATTRAAVDHALKLVAQGADIIDVGAESTRPGANPVDLADERERVLTFLEAFREQSDHPVSVDTMKPALAALAMRDGAQIWNDVSALRFDESAPRIAAQLQCPLVLMHMQGMPKTMQDAPTYDDCVREVIAFLNARIAAARQAGVAQDAIWVDPGIGFGKTLAHNLELMRALPRLKSETGCRLLFGASRKRFIAALDPRNTDVRRRTGGSVAVALHAARMGADIIRVHDVEETVQALRVQAALV